MKFMISLICLLLFSGCATTGGDLAAINARIETRAERLATIGGHVLQRVGPIIAAGTCIATPEYCVAAKTAYRAANAMVTAIRAAKEDDGGLKLATLAQEFVKNIDVINEVLTATGQEKIDLSEFQTTLQEISAAK